jgi:hypothetical protein
MAENILLGDSENGTTLLRGRRSAIETDRLVGDRDELVGLLENNWADVGGTLATIKSSAGVLSALQVLKERSQNRVVQTLLRASSKLATARSLNDMRRRVGELNAARMKQWGQREKCRQNLEVAERAAQGPLSDRDRMVVAEETKLRTEAFDKAKNEYEKIQRDQKDMEEELADGEAYFARTEFVDFCQSDRYRPSALNTANAIAGLPYMGWRQSVKRSQPHKPLGANGGAIQIFNTIRRIVQSCPRKSEMVQHARQWLEHPVYVSQKSYGVTELRRDWYYLRSSIKTVLEAGTRTRELPYAIAREYADRKIKATNVDRLLEEGHRIG